ncbi:acyltransferase family protein [Micromonospora arborensis]|uniref:acyltransferase family protein n=1 Tax=Micromonospora arborensis TaxID=2116518 RepID=UPI00371559F4
MLAIPRPRPSVSSAAPSSGPPSKWPGTAAEQFGRPSDPVRTARLWHALRASCFSPLGRSSVLPLLQRAARRSTTSVPLDQAYAGRANSFGFLRLGFAFAVVLSHAAVLGFGRPITHRVDISGLAVAGFFGVSGFLITRSARRISLPRFLWHRGLRIWPGLWVCLLFIGFVVAPVLYLARHGTLDGLWWGPNGVFNYLRSNWWGGMRQDSIADLLRGDTPYWRWTGGHPINGSLWTLAYEITCYLLVAIAAVLTLLRRQFRLLPLLVMVAVFGVLCWNYNQQVTGGEGILTNGSIGPVPLLGWFSASYFLWYAFMFLAGGVAELYSDRLPINDLLGVLALAVVGWFAFHGAFFGPGLLAYAYVILWLAVRLPKALHRVGQANDYSYGVYIYSFTVQQVMAKVGVQAIGIVGFFLASALVSTGLAVVSWHLVEKPALRLKNWTPRVPGRRADNAVGDGVPSGTSAVEGHTAAPIRAGAAESDRNPATTPSAT